MNTGTLSVWSSMFMELPPEEMVECFLRCGFQATELSYEHAAKLLERGPAAGAAGAAFRMFIDERAFSIPQAHLDFVRCDPVAVDPEERKRNLADLKSQIELFAVLGVRSMVLHANARQTVGAEWSRERTLGIALESLRELGEFAAQFDVLICLENLRPPAYDNLPQYSSADLLSLIDKVGLPNYAICLDTGHLALSQAESFGSFIRNCGDKLRALHIADNFGSNDDHRLPYTGNAVDWEEVAKALHQINYRDLVNFEIPGERSCPQPILELKTRFALELGKHIFFGS